MHYADIGKIKQSKRESKQNLTGIPMQMKEDFEQRSGLSFDDVRVHYASDRPARFGALAYTQGNQVYIGPGQEKHLSHELSHVVQQKLNMVRPNGTVNGEPLNDDSALEQAADRMEFPNMNTQKGTGNISGGIVQRTVWKLNNGRWRKFSKLKNPGTRPLPSVDTAQDIPADGSFFDDETGDTFPPNSVQFMGSLVRRRHERAKLGVYDNVVTGISRREPQKATPVPTPADPQGRHSKLYRFRGQLLISGSGFGERRPPRSSRAVRKGPPAYDDIPERAPFPVGTFSSAARFLIQQPDMDMPSVPSELTEEQKARIASLTLIQGSEEKRVPTGGSLPYAFLMAAEQQGPAAAIAQYPFAPRGGTAYTRSLATGQEDFTPKQAAMFLPNMPSSPRLMHQEDEDA